MNETAILIQQDRKRTLVALGVMLFVIFSLSYFGWTITLTGHKAELLKFMGRYVLPPMGLYLCFLGVSRLMNKTPNFHADAKGIYIYNNSCTGKLLAWDEFSSVQIRNVQGQRALFFVYRNPRGLNNHVNAALGFPQGVCVYQIALPYSLEELLQKVSQYPAAAHLDTKLRRRVS